MLEGVNKRWVGGSPVNGSPSGWWIAAKAGPHKLDKGARREGKGVGVCEGEGEVEEWGCEWSALSLQLWKEAQNEVEEWKKVQKGAEGKEKTSLTTCLSLSLSLYFSYSPSYSQADFGEGVSASRV